MEIFWLIAFGRVGVIDRRDRAFNTLKAKPGTIASQEVLVQAFRPPIITLESTAGVRNKSNKSLAKSKKSMAICKLNSLKAYV